MPALSSTLMSVQPRVSSVGELLLEGEFGKAPAEECGRLRFVAVETLDEIVVLDDPSSGP